MENRFTICKTEVKQSGFVLWISYQHHKVTKKYPHKKGRHASLPKLIKNLEEKYEDSILFHSNQYNNVLSLLHIGRMEFPRLRL